MDFDLSVIPYWTLLVVDDDPGVIDATEFALEEFEFLDRNLNILTASSKQEAMEIFEKRDDIAVALIDIIMENDQAGLELIEHIRTTRQNPLSRLVVRTGQPGRFPEESVFTTYDIHLYLDKADLDASQLTYAITSALRSYIDLRKLDYYASHLETLVEQRTQELANLNRDLEKRVEEETTKRIEQERIVIQQAKMAAAGEMLGAITHQWKQPLSAISLATQLVFEDFKTGELEFATMERRMKLVQDRIQFLSDTMNEFRIFFKPNKEKCYFRPKIEIEKIVGIMCPHLDAARITVDVDMPDSLELLGFPNEFKQVALNLLNNARDAIMGNKTPNGRVIIRGFEQEGKTTISFLDNGGGIPEHVMQRLFEKFVTSKGEEGTGIGLHLCQTIIEEHHGGRIKAVNHDNGVEFLIELDSVA